jgi:AraC-like DNA-binding protein
MHPQTHRDLREARDFMRYAYGCPVYLPDVAARANLSPYHFLRVYKQAYGETPHEFLTRLRIDRAKTLLARGSHNVTEACFEVGFSSLGSFSALFAHRVGLSPSEYRRYARSTISVPEAVRPLFVPSCFLAMLYGSTDNRNFREVGKSPPIVSSNQSSETGR